MINKVVIQNKETKKYLMSIYVGRTSVVKSIVWTDFIKNAIHFENKEMANSTIIFIGDVMDWELEQQLEYIEIQEENDERYLKFK